MKKIKKILSVLACTALSIAPVTTMAFATESVQSNMAEIAIKIKCDEDIQLTEGDEFVLSYALQSNPQNEAYITIDASLYIYDDAILELPADTYVINDIVYKGSNEDIISQGYGCNDTFSKKIILAIGDTQTNKLEKDYRSKIKDANHSDTGIASRPHLNEMVEEGGKAPLPQTEDEYQEQLKHQQENDNETSSPSIENPDGEGEIKPGDNTDITDDEDNTVITDNGEAQVEDYLENDKDGEKPNVEKKSNLVLGKLIGILILTIGGLGTIFYLHKKGKV